MDKYKLEVKFTLRPWHLLIGSHLAAFALGLAVMKSALMGGM